MRRDMYIDYQRSYRRRGRRSNRLFVKIVVVVLLAAGLVFGSFYAIMRQIELNRGTADIQAPVAANPVSYDEWILWNAGGKYSVDGL